MAKSVWGRAFIPMALLLSWIVAAILVDPRGDFPTNDDWAYAHVVKTWFETGELRFTDWQSMPLLTHVLWGALFCLPFGYSFLTLRIAVLAAGWLGGLALYGLMRELGARRVMAGLGAATLLFNPIYFSLSHTYMTDVPFVAMVLGAVWMRVRGAKGRKAWTFGSIVLIVTATLSRQLGLAVALAFAVADVVVARERRGSLLASLVALLITVAALWGYNTWLETSMGLPALYEAKTHGLRDALSELARMRGLRLPAERSLIAACTLGLFCLPMLVVRPMLSDPAQKQARMVRWCAGGLLALALLALGRTMPMTGNILAQTGLGTHTLLGTVEPAQGWFWSLVTVIAAFAGVQIFAACFHALLHAVRGRLSGARLEQPLRKVPNLRVSPWHAAVFVGVIALFHGPTAIVHGAYFDRYLLPVLPMVVCLLWAQREERLEPVRLGFAVSLLTILAFFSIAGTHDYMAWQRARWNAVLELEDRGVRGDQRVAGFEIDHYGPEANPRVEGTHLGGARVAIAVSELPGFERVRAVPVGAWLPFGVRTLHELVRVEE